MSARNHCQHHMQSKITCEKRSQRAHSKLLVRSSRKIATSAKVRDNSTGKEIAGGSGSDLGVFHHGMITAANKRKTILHSNVLAQTRSSTVPGRVASCSRLPLEGTLDGRIPKKGMRCWWAETHSKTAQTTELQATASVSVFITNNRSYLTRSISDTAQKLSPCPDSHNLHVSTSRSYSI